MKKRIASLLAITLLNPALHAATEKIVWTKASDYFPPKQFQTQGFLALKNKDNNYQIKVLDETSKTDPNHIRYQLYFKNIPIWGHELILHKNSKDRDTITGVEVVGLEHDIKDTVGKLTLEEVEKKIVENTQASIVFKSSEKIIYLDAINTAHLAYQVTMYTNDPVEFIKAPTTIVDANTGKVLDEWNNLNHLKVGQGLGGNVLKLPYRSGLFQHGTAENGVPSLGKFDVEIKKGRCYVQNNDIRIINVNETTLDRNSFPLLSVFEAFTKLPTFSYPCDEKSKYYNKNDGNTAPANHSFSSVNDSMYFATVTLEMYKNYYGVDNPLGDDLPVRAYTHIRHLDNAFAVPHIKWKGITIIHQQIVIGDGDELFTAPAQATLAHELSHNFTQLYSKLVYKGHSGGINESFSDMASIAMLDYVRKDYPWYWDGLDYGIGREATFTPEPLRYMDDPEKDGKSIGNASKYEDGMDVHDSSGVFNKAFYLLANSPNWTVRKAFQVMVDANKKYWTSDTHFEAAACGVIQATIDRKYSKAEVITAFAEVGVNCPLKSLTQ